jgi:hypothetical protein
MLAEQFLAAAAGARNSTALDEIARLTWRAHSEGHLADTDAEAVSEALTEAEEGLRRQEGSTSPFTAEACPEPPRAVIRSASFP